MTSSRANKLRPEPENVLRAVEAGDIDLVESLLTPRQRNFANEYIVDFAGDLAVLRAGYKTKHPAKVAHQLLRHAGVRAVIEAKSLSKEAKITAVDPNYIIGEITSVIHKDGVKDADKLRALEMLARHLGMFIDRTELTGKDGAAIEIENRRVEEEARDFALQFKTLQDRAKKEVKIL